MAKYNLSETEMLKAFDDFWSEEDLTRAIESLIKAGECKSMDNKDASMRDIKFTIELGDWFIPKKYYSSKSHEFTKVKDCFNVFTVVEFESGYGIVDLANNALLDSNDYHSDNGRSLGGWYSTEAELQSDCDYVFGKDNYIIIKKCTIDYYLPAILSSLWS